MPGEFEIPHSHRRVGLVIYLPNFFGGENKFSCDLAACLIDAGFEVAISSLAKPREGKCYEEFLRVQNWFTPKVTFNLGKLYRMIFNQRQNLNKMIKEFKPEFIIGSATEPAVMLGLKAKKIMYTHFPTELRMSSHSLLAEVYRSVYWWQHNKALSELNAIVCNSEFTKTITWMAWRRSQPDKAKYSVIYPSVDTEKLKDAMRLQRDPYKICYVGRLDKDKGIDYVLDAFQKIKKEIPGAKLEIVGAVSKSKTAQAYFSDLTAKAEKIGDVIFKTNVPESGIVETLSTAQCMASFNPDEHFGIVPIEAMALGCPPIVADGGGQRETVIHGETGFLAKEPSEIEVYIHKLLTDNKLASYVSEKAMVHAEKFSRKSFVEKWIELFNIVR